MNVKTLGRDLSLLAGALAVFALAAAPSFAQTTYNLCATTGTVTMPDAVVVPIWGYVDVGAGACAPGLASALPGPVLRPAPGDTTLTVNLSNALAEPVSFFVPGLRAGTVGGTAGKFTAEVAAGGTASYTFDLAGRAGTFLYHSATDRIRTQMPMGLYGALVVQPAAGTAYPGVTYDRDQVLVYSAIDPRLNADPGGFGGARVAGPRAAQDKPIGNWDPQYFLINGQPHPAAAHVAITTGENFLLRFVNAGLDTVAPTLGGGLYVDLVAEDGNLYPHPMKQYGVELPAGKTIDAMVQVANAGTYALYERGGRLTNRATTGGGMLTYLDVAAGAGLLQLSSATYSVAENGGVLTVTVERVGGSAGAVSVDYATADGTATAAGLDYTAVPATTLNFADLQTSATFNVTILDDTPAVYEGSETFTVSLGNAVGATLGAPVSATVTIADDDPAPGALQLSAATYGVAENGGTLTVTVNRVGGDAGAVSVNYATASGTATAGSDYTAVPATTLNFAALQTSATFIVTILDDPTYEGNETFGVNLSSPGGGATLGAPASAVVTITENDAAPNVAPFANDDVATTPKNTAIVINVVANDVDADGTINAATVVITTGPNSQLGGTVVNNLNGTVTFTPKRGFRGTDTFQYNVRDNAGALSNTATVRVNVN